MPRIATGAALAATLVLSTGCATKTQEAGLIGAGAGAAIGAWIGSNNGGTAEGAIIGAAVGGAAGALIGRQMDQKADELARRLPDARVERVGEGILVTFDSGILFGFDSADLQATAQTNLAALANSLDDIEEDAVLMVVGHTDATGSQDYNQRLSERRAQSAARYLQAQGMRPANLETLGLGESEPVASNDTEIGQAENRRVEVAIFASAEYRDRIQGRVGS
jgi:outer membrane protein OmpA-like peptidoglycan-associated protein